jgi:SPP1 family predicted phage head-tail adaptor
MRSGRLRHRLRFERATETQNQFGEPVQTWAEIKTVWGAVEPLRGAERQRANQTQADEDVRLVARYSSELATLNPKDRCVAVGKVYDIKSVLNIDERNREFNVMAREHIG